MIRRRRAPAGEGATTLGPQPVPNGDAATTLGRTETRHNRREGAHDRYEPGQDDRLAAVLLVEGVRPLEVLRPEQPRVRVREEPSPDPVADRVAQAVAR